MYIATYYSFKGGVGRTMALVNTAAELARRGRRVLLVDFDLEAPGISTYPPFRPTERSRGIVDYVKQYLDSGEAPDVSDYIKECKLNGQSVWVMPSGLQDASYPNRLASINWQELYSKHDGYLMFEDLKQQWASQEASFDYVLIDSRTGHTDVGGICTRQLPNAVVLLFYPNDQNIEGLKGVVSDIRDENERRQASIRLLFCPSNVPNLDDEEEILKRQLDRARRDLRYGKPASVLHHYDSLALLDQPIFITDRSRSRLAQEYRDLTTDLVMDNLVDRDGALSKIDQVRDRWRNGKENMSELIDLGSSFLSIYNDVLDEIYKLHPADGEVALKLASAYKDLGNLTKEFDALSVVIERGHRVADARLQRATNLLSQGRRTEALVDLRAVVSLPDAEARNIIAAVQLLKGNDADWISVVERSKVLDQLKPREKVEIADELGTHPEGLRLAAKLALSVLSEMQTQEKTRGNVNISSGAHVTAVISMIGSGDFVRAQHEITSWAGPIDASLDIREVFNYAMALWGETGEPPRDILLRVTELDEASPARREVEGANYHQCMALTHAALGNSAEAEREIGLAESAIIFRRLWSCWRYLSVDRDQFLEDGRAIVRLAENGDEKPEFIIRGR